MARVVPYIVAQLCGAIVAAAVLFTLFSGFLIAKEQEKKVVRGEPGSIVTAMCYGEYFPNPGPLAGAMGPYDAHAHAALPRSLATAPLRSPSFWAPWCWLRLCLR